MTDHVVDGFFPDGALGLFGQIALQASRNSSSVSYLPSSLASSSSSSGNSRFLTSSTVISVASRPAYSHHVHRGREREAELLLIANGHANHVVDKRSIGKQGLVVEQDIQVFFLEQSFALGRVFYQLRLPRPSLPPPQGQQGAGPGLPCRR